MPDALLFWPIAAAMTALAVAFALPRRHGRRVPPPRASTGAINAAICRSELAELDRQHGDGTLTDAEHARSRDDAKRRLLADVAPDATPMARAIPAAPPPRGLAFATAIVLPALAFGLYAVFGDPGALSRVPPDVAVAPRDAIALPARDDLVRHLARHPADGRGWVMLARTDFAAERFGDAAEAFAQATAVSAKIAADAGVWCEYADALGMAQGGTLAGRPAGLVQRALALDPTHPKALELAGSAAVEQRDYASAAQHWRRLLPRLPAGSREHAELAAAIAHVDRLAGAGSNGVAK